MEQYQSVLLKILKLHGDVEKKLDEVVKIIARELSVDRVSFWRGSKALGGLSCLSLYNSKENKIERDHFLPADLYPHYFDALEKCIILDIFDACNDECSFEFRDKYLLPLDIVTMLDAPIIINGEIRGVVCFEVCKQKRVWEPTEKLFAAEVAQYVGHCFIQNERRIFEEKYKITIQNSEEQRRQFQAEFIQASKLSSIGTLATGVAHEINNPLTICFGFLGILEEALESKKVIDDNVQLSLVRLNESLERIRVIVKELRSYARSDSGKMEYVDFHETLKATLLLCHSLFEKENTHINLHLDCPNPIFSGNRAKMQQVIMNILSNAHEAILVSGKKNGVVDIFTYSDESELIIDFLDNGTGISPEIEKKLFQPFFSTKLNNRGRGLGLSIAGQIIHFFGGEIKVFNSADDSGATVRIILPLASIVKKVGSKNDLKSNAHRMKVLIVDDEAEFVDLLKEIFISWDFEVEGASSGNEGLEKIKKNFNYDLIVTDYRMKGLNGLQMMSEARQQGFAGKVLLVTGFMGDLSSTEVKEISLCIDDILRKPFDREILFGVLKQMGFKLGEFT